MSKVVIFGTGRAASIAVRYLQYDSEHEVCGFTVDSQHMKAAEHLGRPLVPYEEVERHFPQERFKMYIPLGYTGLNSLRKAKYLDAKSRGYSFISYVCSKSVMIDKIEIGENCLILENQSFNMDSRIGNNVVIWSGCQIGDCSVIEDHVWISSHVNVGGYSTVGEQTFIGMNTTIGNNTNVASHNFIGACALITSNTNRGETFAHPATKKIDMDSEKFMNVFMTNEY